MLEAIGFEACAACILKMGEMNRRGVQGCRDTRDQIIDWFREAEKAKSWLSKWSAAPKAMLIIPIRHWPPLGDPIPWIVDEAIRRAEAKQAA